LQIPQTSHRHFSSLARRLGRIFAHAYFHHRDAFEQAEAESSLYARFLALTAKFDLVPAEFLVIPSSQFSGDDSREREEYENSRQQYPPQHQQDHHGLSSAITEGREQQDHLIEADIPNRGSTSTNGGIGESPSASSRSRFGRNRTGTMVFADVEATAIADELAARARVGDFEPDFEAGEPKTAPPADQEQEDLEADADTQFEISLDPEEEIPDVFTEDITAVPDESSLSLEKVQEAPPLPVEDAAPEEEKLEVDDLVLELELVGTVPAEFPVVEQPTPEPTAVVPPAEPEISKSVEDAELLQAPAPVPEPVAEVSEILPPSTTAEAVPLLPEPQLDIDELASSTIEIPPSSVEPSTPAPAPVAADASIPLDALEPVVDETTTTVAEKAEVAPTLIENDVAPVASTTETPSVNEETPRNADVKEETLNAPQPS